MCAGFLWLRQDLLEEYMHAWLPPPQMSVMVGGGLRERFTEQLGTNASSLPPPPPGLT